MKTVLVQTADAVLTIDPEAGVVDIETGAQLDPPPNVRVSLPGVRACVASGSTLVALVGRRPPLVVSHDAGRTWHESGSGLPAGRAIAIDSEDPDAILFAARNRIWASHDGGRFWESLALDLPEVEAVAFA
jgi:photosystem II stability/assembly factor-like uncharacterized protein